MLKPKPSPTHRDAAIRALLLLVTLLASPFANAQTEGLLQVEDEFHAFLERQQALGRLPGAALGAKPLSAYEARALLDTLAVRVAVAPGAFTALDRRMLAEYRGEEVGGLLRGVAGSVPWLYANGRTALSVTGEDYGLEAEPLAVLAFGPVRQSARQGREATATAWQNTRGVRAAGHLDAGAGFGRVFFETRIEENQVHLSRPAFSPGLRPRLGFTHQPSPGVFDYFVATGVVGYHTERFEARFGRDRNRWGFGRESVVLTNYAPVYDQLQLRWQVWRLDFTNLFARFTEPTSPQGGDALLPQHFGALHRLALDLGYGLEAEAFESVIFASDSTGRAGFELAYLSPLPLRSQDNLLLGAGLAWTATPGLRVYGQLILDNLRVSEPSDAAWENQWAYLVGTYVVDPPVPGGGRVRGLNLRVEYARLRPYLYAHTSRSTAYVHYRGGVGHPAGPNASDLAFSVQYQPDPNWHAAIDLVYTLRGRNAGEGADLENYGSDPFLSFDTRVGDAGIETLQGVRQETVLVEARAEVRLLPQLYAGGALRYEAVDDAEAGMDRYLMPQVMLRWGLPYPSLRY